jgi:excisionase family DNA binding protein
MTTPRGHQASITVPDRSAEGSEWPIVSGSLSEPLLTPGDVATLLGVKRCTIYELTRAGRLPSVRVGRAIRFLRTDLEAWLNEQRGTR